MWYYFLLATLIVLAIIYYKIFKKDVLSVAFISCTIYALSTFSALISFITENSWNDIDIGFATYGYIVLGMICVGAGEFFVRKITIKKKKDNAIKNNEIQFIKISDIKLIICIAFIAISTILIFINLRQITGGSDFSKIISTYNQNSVLYNNDEDTILQINTVYTQLYRISVSISIVLLYVFVNNMCFNWKLKNNYIFLIPIFCAMLSSILLGGRSSVLRFLVAAFIFFIVIKSRNKKIKLFKFVKIGILILIVILPIFYGLITVIGRSTNSNFFDYITFYLGGPIPGFDMFLQDFDNTINTTAFGEHTFIGINRMLYKFNIIDNFSVYQGTWINFGNGLYSNVFSGLKAYLQDFGIYGFVICEIFFGLFYSFLYKQAENKSENWLIFYGFIAITLIDQYRTEKIFSAIITIDTVVYILGIVLTTYFLFKFKPKWR